MKREGIESAIANIEDRLQRTLAAIQKEVQMPMKVAHAIACASDIYEDMKNLTRLAIDYSMDYESDDYKPYDASGIGHLLSEIINARFEGDWTVINSCQKTIDDFMHEFDNACTVYSGYLIEGLTENCMAIFQWLIWNKDILTFPTEFLIDEIVSRLAEKPLSAIVSDFSLKAFNDISKAAHRNPPGRPTKSSNAFTQEQIAKAFKVSVSRVEHWDAGRGNPPPGYSRKIREDGDLVAICECVRKYDPNYKVKHALSSKDVVRDGYNDNMVAHGAGQICDALNNLRNGEGFV